MITISKVKIPSSTEKIIARILGSGKLVQGEYVKKIEEAIKKRCKAKHAVATNSGTSALHSALYACGITSGDEVITTPFTFIATANSIVMAGARPVFVDIDEKTYNIDPSSIESAISKKTKAILIVDLYGQPADYNLVRQVANKYNLKIIEDAAQSIDAEYRSKKVGSYADLTTFSFYATKNLMAGEGGMVLTNNPVYAEKVKLFRHHGQRESSNYEYLDVGYNYRMTDLHAVIGMDQLRNLDYLTKKRRSIANEYNNAFRNIPGIITPFVPDYIKHVYHQYTIRVAKEFSMNRDQLLIYLEKRGIQARIYYPKPLYCFNHLKSLKNKFNQKSIDKIAQQVLSIPVHPYLTDQEVKYIINCIVNI